MKKNLLIAFVALAVLICAAGCTSPKVTKHPNNDVTIANNKTTKSIPPNDSDGKFSIAVIPDTQQEVVVEAAINGEHFKNRSKWLVDNAEYYDLRFVIHTGDVVNWGNEDRTQLEIASDAIAVLDDADIPVALALGNHDTAAVGVGGSAAVPSQTKQRVRDTIAFNDYFSTERYGDCITYEEGKIDNSYQYFTAAGKKWMVMCLELWPRDEVIAWANRIIEKRPQYNVIIATHSYLTGNGDIYQSNGGYGANSPEYLFEELISKHENIKIVLSGHTGNSAVREDTGISGNKIVSILGCFHSSLSNPVRILEIDAENGTLSGFVYSPIDSEEWEEYKFKVNGMKFN